MTDLVVDPHALRDQVRDKYREVALDPHRTYHFHTGRPLAAARSLVQLPARLPWEQGKLHYGTRR